MSIFTHNAGGSAASGPSDLSVIEDVIFRDELVVNGTIIITVNGRMSVLPSATQTHLTTVALGSTVTID